MRYHRLPTAPLASRHRGAGGGAVDNRQPQGSTYLRLNSVQSSGAASSQAVLDLARPDARRVYVGKERDNHTLPQREINAVLSALARAGFTIARVKGGDPFVFGRGGEELQSLNADGISAEVIPEITAACGNAAATGVPLTHRDHAQACVFVTGHLKDGSIDLGWVALARPKQTLVVYMGLKGLDVLARKLIEHGLSDRTPAMIVQKAPPRSNASCAARLAPCRALPRWPPSSRLRSSSSAMSSRLAAQCSKTPRPSFAKKRQPVNRSPAPRW